MLTLDRREIALSNALINLEVNHTMRELLVGGVLCEYETRNPWIVERKQASDLVNSFSSGRLFE